jgi:hypothetical protein
MVIALLAVPGVDRDRNRGAGCCGAGPRALGLPPARRVPGVIRVTGGEVPGVGMKWRRGYGRWVREILVWTTAPFLFRDELVVADAAWALLARPIRVR